MLIKTIKVDYHYVRRLKINVLETATSGIAVNDLYGCVTRTWISHVHSSDKVATNQKQIE
jgi:hypothetical protein